MISGFETDHLYDTIELCHSKERDPLPFSWQRVTERKDREGRTMICPTCGAEVPGGMSVCLECGAIVGSVQASSGHM